MHSVQLSTQDVDTLGDVGHDPVKALLDVGADAGAARTDRPRVRLDGSQVQPLLGVAGHRIIVGPGLSASLRSSASGRTAGRTLAMASSEWAPGMSCLFASTSNDAPVSRWPPGHPRHAASLEHISMHGGYQCRSSRDAGTDLFLQERVELLLAVWQAGGVGGVHDPDHAVGLLKVVAPKRPNGLLPANVPDVERVANLFSESANGALV